MLYRATVIDVPGDPFTSEPDAALAVEQDGGILVDDDGVIAARGPFAAVHAAHPDAPVIELDGVLLPGFVDTHVHYPQIRSVGGLGMPLLDWLERCALPEESRLADVDYAARVAEEFVGALIAAGTTSALVFGSHFAGATEAFFATASSCGINVVAGLVLSDRLLRAELLSGAERCYEQSSALLARWHGHDGGRVRYAVTPRFALSSSEAVMDVCASLLQQAPDVWFTTHVNENPVEIATVAGLFPQARHYLDTYHRHGLVTSRSVFAHNVHASDDELDLMAAAGAWTSHCPTSNAALGSGLFPLRRHVEHGVGVALGSDVGAGTGPFLGKEALQAYFMQQMLGADGYPLTPVHLLYLATRAGARSLGIDARVGDLSVGKQFDAVLVDPPRSSVLAVNLAGANDATNALARIFALATSTDLTQVWSRGRQLKTADPRQLLTVAS